MMQHFHHPVPQLFNLLFLTFRARISRLVHRSQRFESPTVRLNENRQLSLSKHFEKVLNPVSVFSCAVLLWVLLKACKKAVLWSGTFCKALIVLNWCKPR
jgi:hypothetical protein